MHVKIGHSTRVRTEDAIQEIIRACETDEVPVAGLLWTTTEYDASQVVSAIAQRWPGLPLAGCTTDGVFSSEAGFSHDGVMLTLFYGKSLRAELRCARDLSTGSAEAIAEACDSLSENPALCFLFPSSVTHDVHRTVSAIEERLECPVLGGCSADHREFTSCQEIAGEQILTDSMPILALYGPLEVKLAIGSGWFPMGREFKVTAVDGRTVLELDGAPALELFTAYYGSLPDDLVVEFPLTVFPEEDSDHYFRGVFGIDHEQGTLMLGGEIPVGATVRMSEVVVERLMSAATESISSGLEQMDDPCAAFVFNCAGRKWVLGTHADTEVQELLTRLGDVPTCGMYGYGEIGRVSSDSSTAYHNETCVTVLLRER